MAYKALGTLGTDSTGAAIEGLSGVASRMRRSHRLVVAFRRLGIGMQLGSAVLSGAVVLPMAFEDCTESTDGAGDPRMNTFSQ